MTFLPLNFRTEGEIIKTRRSSDYFNTGGALLSDMQLALQTRLSERINVYEGLGLPKELF
jgi:hypothetical protein